MERLKSLAMWFQNFGYSVVRKNRSIAPQSAVALYAKTRRRVNSLESLSYFGSLPTIPISSVIMANMGTPSTKAANIRCTSAAIQTAARMPMTGKCPYAPTVSAALCTRRSGRLLIAHEEWRSLREVNRHRAPHLGHQVDGDFGESPLPRVILEPLDHDTA